MTNYLWKALHCCLFRVDVGTWEEDQGKELSTEMGRTMLWWEYSADIPPPDCSEGQRKYITSQEWADLSVGQNLRQRELKSPPGYFLPALSRLSFQFPNSQFPITNMTERNEAQQTFWLLR